MKTVVVLALLSASVFAQELPKMCGADGKQQCVAGGAPPDCAKGEYRSQDGRCLHDQTGESHPAGDGCNVATCMDPACRMASTTLMYCSHGDDPALPEPPKTPGITAGNGISVSSGTSNSITIETPILPKMYCGKHSIGLWLMRPTDANAVYQCVSRKEAKAWAKQQEKQQH